MYFRFGCALVLAVLISLAGTALEKENLELRRKVSRQHYQEDVLLEDHAAHRVKAQLLGAPARVIDTLEVESLPAAPTAKSKTPAKPARKNNR